jgi:threonylcarbamoyladenosine tRNA methylthiotransferase MtaB
MKTFKIHTLGCKVNQYESRQIQQWLTDAGLTAANGTGLADLVVVNTCCVTAAASSKSRQAIRKIHKENPQAILLIAGCLPAGPAAESENLPKNAVFVPEKNRLPEILRAILTKNSRPLPDFVSKPPSADKIKRKKGLIAQENEFTDPLGSLRDYSGQTRAFLKIQDGCDAHCTYCIVSKIRTQLWSKPVEIILKEAHSLVSAGHPEIVLSGIFLGAWGRHTARRKHWDPAQPGQLPDLLRLTAQIPGLERLRLSSLEPADVTDELIEVYRQYPNLVPHLHLPLQSGSDPILRRMARQYRAGEYLDICRKIQQTLDRPAITTDIIVGFPGETEEDFERTLQICRLVNFAKIHVFPFSPRRGTAAADFRPSVPAKSIRQRADTLRQLDAQLQQKFRRQFIGEKIRVIVEQTDSPQGRSDRYFTVDCSNADHNMTYRKGQVLYTTLFA